MPEPHPRASARSKYHSRKSRERCRQLIVRNFDCPFFVLIANPPLRAGTRACAQKAVRQNQRSPRKCPQRTCLDLLFFEPNRAGKGSGGEGEIRTPDSLATMPDFESGAFNRALPPLRYGTAVSCVQCRARRPASMGKNRLRHTPGPRSPTRPQVTGSAGGFHQPDVKTLV